MCFFLLVEKGKFLDGWGEAHPLTVAEGCMSTGETTESVPHVCIRERYKTEGYGNAEEMSTVMLNELKLQRGYDDVEAGKVQNAASAFAKFKENH